MRRLLSSIVLMMFTILCMGQNQTLRVSAISDNSGGISATFNILSPNGGYIYVGSTPDGYTNSTVVEPLFVNSNNETLLCFQYTHSCNCQNPNHTLFITNSAGWDTEIPVGSQYYFNQMVPLDPSGHTVITIELRRN